MGIKYKDLEHYHRNHLHNIDAKNMTAQKLQDRIFRKVKSHGNNKHKGRERYGDGKDRIKTYFWLFRGKSERWGIHILDMSTRGGEGH